MKIAFVISISLIVFIISCSKTSVTPRYNEEQFIFFFENYLQLDSNHKLTFSHEKNAVGDFVRTTARNTIHGEFSDSAIIFNHYYDTYGRIDSTSVSDDRKYVLCYGYAYDEHGSVFLVSETNKTYFTDTFYITLDNEHRINRKALKRDEDYVYTYKYDENSRITESFLTWYSSKNSFVYEDNNLVKIIHTDDEWWFDILFKWDENDRLIKRSGEYPFWHTYEYEYLTDKMIITKKDDVGDILSITEKGFKGKVLSHEEFAINQN